MRYPLLEGLRVVAGTSEGPEEWRDVPADGETMGEILFRGNVTMKGCLIKDLIKDQYA